MTGGRLFRDLRLNWKVGLALTAAFTTVAVAFLLVLIPFQRAQRRRILDRDERLLSVLREKHQRDLIYDVLSENEESLAVDLADLARQPGMVWVRLQAGELTLAATMDRAVMRQLLPPGALEGLGEDAVLLLRSDGATVLGPGGQPVVASQPVAPAERARVELPPAVVNGPFHEITWNGEGVLHHQAELSAGDEVFGRLDLVYSLAELRRGESLTRRLFYGLVLGSFLLLLLVLNLLLSRLSKRDIEDYSRNLEIKVAERTRALRESEEQLRTLKNHLETILVHVATGVVSLDEDGRVSTFNDRAGEILSLSAEEAAGRPFSEVLGASSERLGALVETVRRGERDVAKGQVDVRLPAGRRTLSVVASSLPGPGGRAGTVVVFEDITQLIASQRLEAWKEAVDRVIHEIKNPLTPVGLAAQTLRNAYEHDRSKFEQIFPSAIEMILRAVRDLKNLITDFTRFYRLPAAVMKREDVNALVADALDLYEQAGMAGITIERDLAPSLPKVEMDGEQMRRVLLNVIGNGIDAMERGGGRLTVRTASAGSQVTIAVTDQGAGIEDVERIFEPYYTTKAKGTGLGLIISRQIVEDHHGRVRVKSEVGVGTTVEIELPAAAPQTEAAAPAAGSAPAGS